MGNPRVVNYWGGVPIGTILSLMGNHAPAGYLICNGDVINISAYPDLASYFEQEFGSINYFGGDGTSTFAVPDSSGDSGRMRIKWQKRFHDPVGHVHGQQRAA